MDYVDVLCIYRVKTRPVTGRHANKIMMRRGELTEHLQSDENVAVPGRFANLASYQRGIAEVSLRPHWVVYSCVALVAGLAWLWLIFLTAGVTRSVDTATIGPGMELWGYILAGIEIDPAGDTLLAFVLKLCSPMVPAGFSAALFFSTLLMWVTMSLAMMLPSAAPMIRTYADIADVAAQKGELVTSVGVLVSGYLVVWFGFSLFMSLVQLALLRLGMAADPVLPLHGFLAGVTLIIASAYQFSRLRQACLYKCRNPFAVMFGKWSQNPGDIFQLGLQQGLFCLGCCWALMSVMLVVGTMNLAWMAFFTLFAVVEKSGEGFATSYLSGGILLLWGCGLCIASFAL